MNTPPAFGPPVAKGRLRVQPEDFVVIELPLVEPEGAGEHSWLRLRKRGQNTAWVAEQLARFAAVRPRDVSYAGLKDRHAVTEQWFSVHLPGRDDPDWSGFAPEGVEVLEVRRHSRKLRRGTLRGNAFRIRVRDFAGEVAALDARLASIRETGCPNYFGEQRFGSGARNLDAARELFRDPRRRLSRSKRSLYLSAVRGHLFNRVLGERVIQGSWDQCLPGDVMQLDGRRGRFRVPVCDPAVAARLAAREIHPTGPLWGRGAPEVEDIALALEQRCLAEQEVYRDGLERLGLEMDRRALRMRVDDLAMQCEGSDPVLTFSLPAGSYATVLLAQLIEAV